MKEGKQQELEDYSETGSEQYKQRGGSLIGRKVGILSNFTSDIVLNLHK
jgi:tetrahydromethanopterin S-methyltransferase subunit G